MSVKQTLFSVFLNIIKDNGSKTTRNTYVKAANRSEASHLAKAKVEGYPGVSKASVTKIN